MVFASGPARTEDHRGRGRIVILMVWDGLRPDMVTQRDTPNLYRMAREGVRFDRHHSVFPTITMANAAALATGAPPGINGLEGNVFYLPPSDASAVKPAQAATDGKSALIFAERPKEILELNRPDRLAGRLLGLDTIAQEIEREGDYIAVIGKEGPAAIFDNRIGSVVDGKDSIGQAHKDYLFISDEMAEPASEAEKVKFALPAETKTRVYDDARDLYFTRVALEQALPAAKKAAEGGRPSLIVLWQHNPDLTQHMAGLGTAPAYEALSLCDNNLARVRSAIEAANVADKTDLIVVSDHGFATIKLRIVLAEMLVAAGIKKSIDSTDIIVAANGGADFIYVSPKDFPTRGSRQAVLQKIVDFCEAQEWCGPIFSREAAQASDDPPKRGRRAKKATQYLGWIDGTFNQSVIGIFNAARSPDLVISLREISDVDNKNFTGPEHPGFVIGKNGQVTSFNKSQRLVRPVKGLVYSDTGAGDTFSTGLGMHGAAGEREIHNFCAAAGPDFRKGFVDFNPTSNIDVAPTITQILGVTRNIGAGGIVPTGRALSEALTEGHRAVGGAHTQTMTADLMLQGVEAVTTIRMTWIGDEAYLDGSNVERKPLGSSP